MDLHVGKHGVVLLVILFLLLGFEDILIWMRTGSLPAIEFFLGMLLVLAVAIFAIREAERHPPHR